jgi:hypothetical protein
MYQIETELLPMAATEAVTTQALPYGGDIDPAHAEACHQLYQQARAENSIQASQCPEAVVFNLGRIRAFLEQMDTVYDQLGVPQADRGLAIMPMQYEKGGAINTMLAPCVKAANGQLVHPFNVTAQGSGVPADLSWWEILWRNYIWNHGGGAV